jgi:hypothetical protein
MGSAHAISGNDNAPEDVVYGPTRALTLLDSSGDEAESVITRVKADRHLFLVAHMMRRMLERGDALERNNIHSLGALTSGRLENSEPAASFLSTSRQMTVCLSMAHRLSSLYRSSSLALLQIGFGRHHFRAQAGRGRRCMVPEFVCRELTSAPYLAEAGLVWRSYT